MKRDNKFFAIIKALALVAAIGLVIYAFSSAVENASAGQQAEGKAQLEAALRKAAVSCYSVEGIYPPNIEYMEEHYGVQINRELYYVDYFIFADNIMPEITVLDNES